MVVEKVRVSEWFGNPDVCGVEMRVQRNQLITRLVVTTEMLKPDGY